jgi:hypothetical protein
MTEVKQITNPPLLRLRGQGRVIGVAILEDLTGVSHAKVPLPLKLHRKQSMQQQRPLG